MRRVRPRLFGDRLGISSQRPAANRPLADRSCRRAVLLPALALAASPLARHGVHTARQPPSCCLSLHRRTSAHIGRTPGALPQLRAQETLGGKKVSEMKGGMRANRHRTAFVRHPGPASPRSASGCQYTPKASWFPLKVGFIDLAGGAHTLPDQAAEVAGVLLALRDQQHRLLSQREEPEETPGWQTSRRDSCRAPEEEGVPSVQLQGRSVGKLEERQKRCFWIVGLEAALRVPQSFREATRAASLQQLKGAVSAELLKIFSVSNVIHVEPKQARTTLARVAGVPLGSRQETLQWLSEQVPSFPSRLRREEAALTMADAWLVAVHAQRTVEAMRLRERLRGFLAAESGRHLFKACGAAHAPSLPAPLPPHLVKLVDTLRVPSGRVEALRQAVAEAADVRTRRELLQVLKSRQESELTQAIARHLDVVYQSARGLFVAPGQSAFPHNGKEGCAVAQSFWEARGSRTADAETAAASAHPHRDGGEATGGQASLSADPVAVQKVRQRARREPRDVRGVERAGGALPHARRNGSTVSQEEAGDNERVGWNVAEPDLRREEPGSPASLGRGRSEREATVAMVASRVAAANAELQASRRNERIHDAGGKSLCPSHHRQGPPTG
ncbi:hypothetical protein NCLIV_066160 [Neospora caninum Liverpool]|uniref:Uncharacterized protein n=1 Tax=Neospora caninum (strain Liverpool) TaxID=572307 RepID=F0VR42_NEOCL|nr:hypothetical protein NCLIV_066160 [Neospora caninum Liverpool]CBZ56190.1 hypothetical protein NCLIV_066160 [Neospora caninum Liverpool]|eukprot:XP_003886215.1 hypothetical protein NCLIV_066160 [Neospora caninum Liverpool]